MGTKGFHTTQVATTTTPLSLTTRIPFTISSNPGGTLPGPLTVPTVYPSGLAASPWLSLELSTSSPENREGMRGGYSLSWGTLGKVIHILEGRAVRQEGIILCCHAVLKEGVLVGRRAWEKNSLKGRQTKFAQTPNSHHASKVPNSAEP